MKVWIIYDYNKYEGSSGPESVWSTEDLAADRICTLKTDKPYNEFVSEEFEVD